MRNEAQDLQAEITRNNQAIVDGCQTREQVGKLEAELEARQHKLQQLEQQEESFRKHEEILKSHIKQLETERNELQATIETRQAQSDKMELDVQQLRDRLSEAETKSMSVQNEVNRRERLRMEQEQAFRMYRLNAVPHLAHSKEQMQQLTAQLQARDIEQHAQSQDLLDSNNKLVAIEQQCTQLLREVSGHRSTVAKLHKEKEAIETNHIAQLSELQQRLNKLQEAKDTSNEQLRRVELDAISKVEQTKEEYLTQIDELKTQLNLSEDARKEAQARVCQVEAANVQQLECHRQETNAKFEKLTIESTLVVARLKKEHLQELEEIRREFDIKFKNHVLEANRQLAEARAGTTNKVLVYNSQFSAEQIPKPASQQPQIGKTRKKVDRQTNSVLEVVPSTQRSVDTDRQASTADRLHPLNTGHEGSVYQNECFFDEEYQNRFGSQVQPREQDVRLSILDPESDVVPETQEFTFAQIESQKSAAGELQQKEIMSDLSTMPSDDLSEMLLDVGPSHGQEHETSRQVTSPDEALEDFGQPGNCPASDAHSTSSQGRPISRANTASRMMPLLAHSKPRQYRQADNIIHDPMREHSDRNSRDSSEELSNPVHTGHSVSRRPYASRSPMHDDVALKSYETGVKRKAHDGNVEQGGRSKKLCASTRSSNQGLSLTSKSYTPYSPTPDGALSNEDTQPSPHSTTGRRSSKRTSSSSGPQAGTLRLSSTRNTRSKGR
jgi:myosin heavy subunit